MVDDSTRDVDPAIAHVAPLAHADEPVTTAQPEPAPARRGSAFARVGAPVALVAAGLVGGAVIGGIASANASTPATSSSTSSATGLTGGTGSTGHAPGMNGGRGDHGRPGLMPGGAGSSSGTTGTAPGELMPAQPGGPQLQQMPQSHGSTGASG